MDLDFLQSQAATLFAYPDLSSPPVSATVTITAPIGGVVVTDDAVVDDVATDIDSVTSLQVFELEDGSEIIPGRSYLLVSATGGVATIQVSSVDTDTIAVVDPPPFTATAGDMVYGLQLSFDLTAPHTANRGEGFRAEFLITCTDGSVVGWTEIFNVVRQVFAPAMTAERVRAYTSTYFAGASSGFSQAKYQSIADRANRRVRASIRKTGRKPYDLYGGSTAFQDAGAMALRWVLAIEEGLVPDGIDQLREYTKDLDLAMDREVHTAVSGLFYDADDNGVLTSKERGPFVMRIRR